MEYADSVIVPEGTTEIISQGGGSTIDVGKWLAKKYNLKHTAIPTTGGTGSEVTKYVVLTIDGKKQTIYAEEAIPDSYILDPKLSVSLPKLQTQASGLDALCQCYEALMSNNHTLESNNYARVGIQLILRSLKECIDNPTNERARMDMLIAANMSGRAINITKTNVCHAISYHLTDKYNIPHGLACAISLPYFHSKWGGHDIRPFLESLDLPTFEYDKEEVANEAMKWTDKLNDFPMPITKDDILSAI